MKSAPLKYNPGIHGDQELIRSFVVRHDSLELILEILRENTGSSNQHVLVVGPRGSGKTMLVRRVAAEVRTDPALDAAWYPLVFAEEPYMVASAGEFWLEALFHLGDQTGDSRWSDTYQDLLGERDETRLRDRALAQLMDFADEEHRRILLVVENLNMLLGEQMKESGEWDLRHALMNEPRLTLLGTATCRFEEIKNIDKAWFELLAVHSLEPLAPEGCQRLWSAATGSELPVRRVRPIQILSGGNPHLLRALAEFAAGRSFRELMSQLVELIDDHTQYFKSLLDNLAATERKIFVTLLDLWDPADARTVARAARMDVNKASVLLNRLVARGAVQILGEHGRRKIYQASERLFNIYYLIRRRGHPSDRVRAAVAFMVQFYDEPDLTSITPREAVAEGNASYLDVMSYAMLLGEQGKWSDALGAVTSVLEDAAGSEVGVRAATKLITEAAAAGHAEEALEKLQGPQISAAFEPLAVGLRVYLGNTPRTAQEILEVGRDVAERIRQRQREQAVQG